MRAVILLRQNNQLVIFKLYFSAVARKKKKNSSIVFVYYVYVYSVKTVNVIHFSDNFFQLLKVPLALAAATDALLLETFTKNNAMLDQIMKCLEAYLETKRVAFPRFYFLSNDELLEILAQVGWRQCCTL